jgi:hypothetical protein
MPTRFYTLTDVARKLGRDYRGIRDRDSISKTPVAIVIIGRKEMKLYKLEQFGLQEPNDLRPNKTSRLANHEKH